MVSPNLMNLLHHCGRRAARHCILALFYSLNESELAAMMARESERASANKNKQETDARCIECATMICEASHVCGQPRATMQHRSPHRGNTDHCTTSHGTAEHQPSLVRYRGSDSVDVFSAIDVSSGSAEVKSCKDDDGVAVYKLMPYPTVLNGPLPSYHYICST